MAMAAAWVSKSRRFGNDIESRRPLEAAFFFGDLC
jgi:hypothetical protein